MESDNVQTMSHNDDMWWEIIYDNSWFDLDHQTYKNKHDAPRAVTTGSGLGVNSGPESKCVTVIGSDPEWVVME